MRERASLLGGTVDIESAPGMGTTVFGELPVDRHDERGVRAAG
jgi:signal transduction histidine kinase